MPGVSRPFGVTLVGIIIVIVGIMAIIGGIAGFFSGDTTGWGVVVFILTILIGLFYLILARGIFVGGAGARAIVALLTLLYIVAGVIYLFTNLWMGIWQIVIGLVILALLFGGRAREFFA